MKVFKTLTLIVILLMTVCCPHFSQNSSSAKIDEFCFKFSIVNNELLGALKEGDPDLDLRTLGEIKYTDLFGRFKLTEDRKMVLDYIRDNASKMKYITLQDTFVICISCEKQSLMVCDDAYTDDTDECQTKKPLPNFDKFYYDFLKEVKQK